MKNKSYPNQVKSGNHFHQALMEGLSEEGKKWAKMQVKKFEENAVPIPYGMLRKMALEFKGNK